MRTFLVLVLFTCLLSTPKNSTADENNLAGASAFGLVALGLFVVDVGVSVANGIAISNGTANKPNGYFSIGAAVASYGMVAAVYAWSDDSASQQNQFALFMGTAGTAALVTGIMVLRQAGARADESESPSRVRVFPTVAPSGGAGPAVGVQLNVDF
jgi:hypothetical protein